MPSRAPHSVRSAREPTDIVALLRATVAPLRDEAAAREIDVRVDALGQPPMLRLVRDYVVWAVTTLVGYALRAVRGASPEQPGGSVLVHVTYESGTRHVAVAVHDDGPGIPQQNARFLFEPPDAAPGSGGVDLRRVRSVAEAHGGGIDVESSCAEDEHGTSITLTFPIDP